MSKEKEEAIYIQITNKGNLFMAFYEALEDKLPEEELSMDLWNKFYDRFIELGGTI